MNEDIPDEFGDFVVPTYIIYLEDGSYGGNHGSSEFQNREEFGLQVTDGIQSQCGPAGHWQSIVDAVNFAKNNEDEVIILVEGNHVFTSDYHKEYLFRNILEANDDNALLLSGANYGFDNVIPLTESRYWVDTLMSTQFLILFSGIFEKIISYEFKTDDTVVSVLSDITSHKMLIFPFISKKSNLESANMNYNGISESVTVPDGFDDPQERLFRIRNAYIKYTSA